MADVCIMIKNWRSSVAWTLRSNKSVLEDTARFNEELSWRAISAAFAERIRH